MKKSVLRLWCDESGASAIELALVSAFILVPLLLGATEIGRRIWVKAQLDNAVRAGVESHVIRRDPGRVIHHPVCRGRNGRQIRGPDR